MRVRLRIVSLREAPARVTGMRYEDLCLTTEPVLSVITPSLNHARFLRATIESVAGQSFRTFEHIVVDGQSTDDTVEILKEYPHIRWISEPDNSLLEAYQKALRMARGKYIIQCCVSDGFLASHWFEKCVALLEKEKDVSLVWALPQYMSEAGALLKVAYPDFLDDPPPQKEDFLPFWLATRIVLPEGNYCVRASVLRETFPDDTAPSHYRIHCHLGFIYNFITRGYLPLFVPEVVNYGRLHADQRGQRLQAEERPAFEQYMEDVRLYATKLFRGEIVHAFRDGNSAMTSEVRAPDARKIRKQYWTHRLLRSRLLRTAPYSFFAKLRAKAGRLLEPGSRKSPFPALPASESATRPPPMSMPKSKEGKLAGLMTRVRRKLYRATGVHYKKSYSQCGEDLIVHFALETMRVVKPTYLDIGAHHPTLFNNTYIFYRDGSRGVNVEPDRALIDRFHRARPDDVNLNCGIGPEEGTLELHVMSLPTLNTFSAEQARRYCEEHGLRVLRKVPVPVKRFDQVVDQHLRKAPDFVSLDAEGVDLPILRSIDFARYRPLVVCVETLTYSDGGGGHKIVEIDELMRGAGYMRYADTFINSIYVDEKEWKRK